QYMIVGDMHSGSDTALTTGAEIVVHADRDGNAPGTERVLSLGVDCVAFAASGTSEDIAMLLAHDKGPELIVAVGTHDTVMEFLHKGRKGMASTFITGLRVGSKLIDAKGLALHYRQPLRRLPLAAPIIARLVALGVAMTATVAGQPFLGLIGAQLDGFVGWIVSLFGPDPAATTQSAGFIQGLTSDWFPLPPRLPRLGLPRPRRRHRPRCGPADGTERRISAEPGRRRELRPREPVD